jgi:tripartite-type tricarboxylate transporter receptor subunit TctC
MLGHIARRFAVKGIFLALGLGAAHAVAAEDYPTRPIDFIVPWGVGGGSDEFARKTATLLEPLLKVSVPVVNVPGASGATGLDKMLTSPADGYTISVFADTISHQLRTPPPKWALQDVVPVGIMISQASGFFVAENSRFKTWADFEKEARQKPDTLKVAIVGLGSADELIVKYFRSKGIKLIAVPFAKPGERYTSILGGHADLLLEQPGDVRSMIKGGQMRPLLMFNDSRLPEHPTTPTTKELGYDITLPQFRAIIVKAGTPPERIKALSDALEKVARSDAYKAYLREQIADEKSFVPAKEAKAFMEGELKKMKQLQSQSATQAAR